MIFEDCSAATGRPNDKRTGSVRVMHVVESEHISKRVRMHARTDPSRSIQKTQYFCLKLFMAKRARVDSLWEIATSNLLPIIAAEKKTEFLDLLLQDEESVAYLTKKIFTAGGPLEDDDLVLVSLKDEAGNSSDYFIQVKDLPFRIAVVCRRWWNDGSYDAEIKQSALDDANDWVVEYMDCLAETAHNACIPVWDAFEYKDVSDFADPGTVLHDAYVYQAIGNELAVIEKMVETMESMTDRDELEARCVAISPTSPGYHPRLRWVKTARMRIRVEF